MSRRCSAVWRSWCETEWWCVIGTENRALLVRVDGVREPEYLQLDGAHHAVMGKGRSMGEGWITVDAEALTSEQALQFWVGAALEHHADTSG